MNRLIQYFDLLKIIFLLSFNLLHLRKSVKRIKGETACLLCVRKENYIWWLSIGDCLVYVFHEELHKLGQYALNQRHFTNGLEM